MHILSSDNRSEFLACPQLVRLDFAQGKDEFESTLLVKGSTLLLKYVIAGVNLQFILVRIKDRLVYGLRIQDDPDKPAILWSAIEKQEEVLALRQMCNDGRCQVFLFNELAVNVAWMEVSLAPPESVLRNLIEGISLARAKNAELSDEVNDTFDRLLSQGLSDSIVVPISSSSSWRKINNVLITNKITQCPIDLFQQDEGNQQEQLAIWLIDNLHPSGAFHRPQIPSGPRKRELTDVLLTYENGSFLVESKSFSLLSRKPLPDRSRLSRAASKDVVEAISQLQGAIRKIRGGTEVTTPYGEVISIEREWPPHGIVLVPDLDLLSDEENYGMELAIEFMKKTHGFLHLLDVAELLRVVQAAEMISAAGKNVSPMMAFDYCLIERAKKAIELRTLRFSVLFRTA